MTSHRSFLKQNCKTVISGFRRDIDEICALLGYYAATFQDKMGPTRCPDASVKDYQSTLRNIPEQRSSQNCKTFIPTRQNKIFLCWDPLGYERWRCLPALKPVNSSACDNNETNRRPRLTGRHLKFVMPVITAISHRWEKSMSRVQPIYAGAEIRFDRLVAWQFL